MPDSYAGAVYSALHSSHFPFPLSRKSEMVFYREADVVDGGAYKVPGTTKVSGAPDVPVSRLVCLFCARSRRLVRAQWSNQDGSYVFFGVRYGPWFVTAHDHTGEYNAVISDNIYGEPM
jgi:hypothetical protein